MAISNTFSKTNRATIGHGLRFLPIAAALAAPFAAHAGPGDDCSESREISQEFSLNDIDSVLIEADAGKLEVVGKRGLTTARVEGVACAKREGDLERIRLVSDRDGGEFVLRTVLPKGNSGLFGNSNPTLDLRVEVPASFAVRTAIEPLVSLMRTAALIQSRKGSLRQWNLS